MSHHHQRRTNGRTTPITEGALSIRSPPTPTHPHSPTLTSPSGNKSKGHPHPLLSHGSCLWPGCNERFDEGRGHQEGIFRDHLNHEHALDERSTAQLRVQVRTKESQIKWHTIFIHNKRFLWHVSSFVVEFIRDNCGDC